jgi:hypothetical protein
MKCVLCEQRKGRRSCPAKSALICGQCCGEKRVLEIDCPESCEYLKAGREWEAEDYRRRIQSLDPAIQQRNWRVLEDYRQVIAYLEYALARQRLLDRDLTDEDVVQAVDILIGTYNTEDRGILYEKTADNLRVESLRRELREIIESHRNPEGDRAKGIVDPKETRLQLGAAIECLEFIHFLATLYMNDREPGPGYVGFLARMLPRGEIRSSLILP